MNIEPSDNWEPQQPPSAMDACYPTEAWSNFPVFHHVSEEIEFWNTYALVDCGDELCAVLIDDGSDALTEATIIEKISRLLPMPKMSLGNIHLVVMLDLSEGNYTSFPIGVDGAVVGQGDTFDEALESAKSATQFHIETFGHEIFHPTESSPEPAPDR
jgi:hypothetical protein